MFTCITVEYCKLSDVLLTINLPPVFKTSFYPNVTTLRSGLCCRNSVCRLSVTLVHPTQGAPTNKRQPYSNSTSAFDLTFHRHRHMILLRSTQFEILTELAIDDSVSTPYRLSKMAATVSQIYFRFQVLWCLIFKKTEIYLRSKFREDTCTSING